MEGSPGRRPIPKCESLQVDELTPYNLACHLILHGNKGYYETASVNVRVRLTITFEFL